MRPAAAAAAAATTQMVARSLCPWYDERFEGYGRNKVVHALALAALGWRFVVDPVAFAVSLPHRASRAFEASWGGNLSIGSSHTHDARFRST